MLAFLGFTIDMNKPRYDIKTTNNRIQRVLCSICFVPLLPSLPQPRTIASSIVLPGVHCGLSAIKGTKAEARGSVLFAPSRVQSPQENIEMHAASLVDGGETPELRAQIGQPSVLKLPVVGSTGVLRFYTNMKSANLHFPVLWATSPETLLTPFPIYPLVHIGKVSRLACNLWNGKLRESFRLTHPLFCGAYPLLHPIIGVRP